METKKVEKFVNMLFISRDVAHAYHTEAIGKSGFHHTALETYYSSIIEFVDSIIEQYQGEYDVILDYLFLDENFTKPENVVDYFTSLADTIKQERKTVFNEEDTHLFAILDDVLSLIYKTLFKLKKLN